MGLMVEFMRGVLSLKKPWIVWVMLLMAANFVAPLFFLGSTEAQVVLAAFMIGAGLQMAILRARGFVRLMGLGHFLWLAMVPWLATRLAAAPEDGALAAWIVAVLVLNGLSLLIDITDVVRYARGERAPTI